MTVSRNSFFLGILLITTTPFLLQKLAWLANAKRTHGVMHYVGKSQSGQIVSIYPVIRFYDGKDSVWFNGASDILLNRGDIVSVLYQRDDHTEAKNRQFHQRVGRHGRLCSSSRYHYPDRFPSTRNCSPAGKGPTWN